MSATSKLESGLPDVTEKTESSGSFANENVVVPDEAPARDMSPVFWGLNVTAILFAIFLFALDNTITADVIPVVIKEFGNAEQLPWLSVAFQIGGVAVILPFGRLFGLFNAKWLYIVFVVLFLVGSALCGAAPNVNAFIVGRVIAGMGGIGIYLGTLTLLSVNTTTKERPLYLSLVGLVFGIGNVVGPVIGGAFADSSATWRWGFYMNLCILGVVMPVYLFLLPSFRPVKDQTVGARLAQIDLVGSILSIGFLICLVMAINFGNTLYPWNSGQIIGLFVVAGVLFLAFAAQQYFTVLTTAANRIFPVSFLMQKEAVLLYILTATINAAAFIPIYYIPTYFQFTRGDTPLTSGVRLLPIIMLITATIMLNGAYLSKGGYYMPWFLVGGILSMIGGVLMSLIRADTPTANIYGFEVLIGIGVGCGVQAGFAVIQTLTEPENLPHAIGFIMTAQFLGVSLGLSIAGAVFVNQALDGLQELLVGRSHAELQAALLGLSGDLLTTLDPELRTRTIDLIISALAKVFIPGYVASAVAIVAAVFLSRRKMAEAAIPL